MLVCFFEKNILYSTKILNCTVDFNINNNKCFFCAENQHMISEGSCDSEDWSNDAEKSQE